MCKRNAVVFPKRACCHFAALGVNCALHLLEDGANFALHHECTDSDYWEALLP